MKLATIIEMEDEPSPVIQGPPNPSVTEPWPLGKALPSGEMVKVAVRGLMGSEGTGVATEESISKLFEDVASSGMVKVSVRMRGPKLSELPDEISAGGVPS